MLVASFGQTPASLQPEAEKYINVNLAVCDVKDLRNSSGSLAVASVMRNSEDSRSIVIITFTRSCIDSSERPSPSETKRFSRANMNKNIFQVKNEKPIVESLNEVKHLTNDVIQSRSVNSASSSSLRVCSYINL